jgi:hypothetical protein
VARLRRLLLLCVLAVLVGAPAAQAITTANLWVDTNGGSCARQASLTAYVDATSCSSMAVADAAATSGDVVGIRPGTYAGTQQINGSTKTVSYFGAGVGSTVFSGGLRFGTDSSQSTNESKNKLVDGVTLTGGFVITCATNITLQNARVLDLTYIEAAQDLVMDNVDFDGTPNAPITDLIDVYTQQPRECRDNTNVTISDSLIHHARADNSAAHPDGLQIAHGGAGGGTNNNIVLQRNRFYDNECPNMRWNSGDTGVIENNYFENGSTEGISTCPANATYQADTGAFTGTVRYNTFAGTAQIQGTAPAEGDHVQNWYGNVMTSFNTGCTDGPGHIGTTTYNLFVGAGCSGTGNIAVASAAARLLNLDGSLQAGSPAIDAGRPQGPFPTDDILGAARFAGAGPDLGAFERGATGGAASITGSNPVTLGDLAAIAILAAAAAGTIVSIRRTSAG